MNLAEGLNSVHSTNLEITLHLDAEFLEFCSLVMYKTKGDALLISRKLLRKKYQIESHIF